mgnify:CR=1 FL=1
MNIFILDQEPKHAAQAHCDKHIAKMILESAQMLSTALGQGYKATHKNHPCTLWTAQSRDNAEWLYELASHLNDEYKRRYKHTVSHKSWDVIRHYHNAQARRVLESSGLTPFALAMPDEYKSNNPVKSYRDYYSTKEKMRYPKDKIPDWFVQRRKIPFTTV